MWSGVSFTPDEICRLTMEFYRRNYIEGLFLSSGVVKSPDYTCEQMIRTLEILRREYGFNGYIHVKAIPGASNDLTRRLGLLLGCLRLCCRLLRSPGGLCLCRYGRTASCAESAVFGDLCSAFFTKSHKFLPSFRADTRSRHAVAVSPRINFYCFYYNKFDFGCKCLSGNFKKTSAALPMFCLRLRKRVKHTHFSKIKPGF